MGVTKARVASELLEPEPTSARDPAADAAVTALLDHLAEELAREYVRLMEKAVGDEGIDGDASR
jgi:ABC-type polar amino acid transport system ATPase subunit